MVVVRGATSGPPCLSAEPVAAEPDAGPLTLVAGPVCAQVGVGLPVPRVFTYIVPCELVDRLAVGQRVRVPFRARSRIGVVVGLGRRLGESGDGAGTQAPTNGPPGLERLQAVVEPVPALTPALLALTRWAAEETASAWGPRRRWQTWWAARQGDARIVVGTRGAAFVPVNPLGLTVVLDEEDPAHKAPDAPCWHARELAIERAAQGGGPCLLAAAAP